MMIATHPSPETRRKVAHIVGWVVPGLILAASYVYSHHRESEWQADKAALMAEKAALVETKRVLQSQIDELAEEGAAILALLASRDTMVAILDADGRVTKWNPAAERYSGWSEEEMKGQTLQRIMTPETWPNHESGFKRFMRDPTSKGRVQIVECPIVHKVRGTSDDPLRVRVQTLGEMRDGVFRRALALGDRTSRVMDLTAHKPTNP